MSKWSTTEEVMGEDQKIQIDFLSCWEFNIEISASIVNYQTKVFEKWDKLKYWEKNEMRLSETKI